MVDASFCRQTEEQKQSTSPSVGTYAVHSMKKMPKKSDVILALLNDFDDQNLENDEMCGKMTSLQFLLIGGVLVGVVSESRLFQTMMVGVSMRQASSTL